MLILNAITWLIKPLCNIRGEGESQEALADNFFDSDGGPNSDMTVEEFDQASQGTAEKPKEETPEQTPEKPVEKKAEPPKKDYLDIEQGFISQDEKTGEQHFDAQSLLDQFAPKPVDLSVKPPSGEDPTAPQPTADGKEPWEVEYEKEQEARKNVMDSLLYGINQFEKILLDAGVNQVPQAVMDAFTKAKFRAEQEANTRLAMDSKKLSYQEKQDRAKAEEQQRLAEQNKSTAIANQQAIAAKLNGGTDTLNKLMHKDLGGKYAYWLFDVMTPDAHKLGPAEYKGKFGEWFTNFSADKRNLDQLVNLARNELIMRNWDHIVAGIKTGAKVQLQNIANGSIKAPDKGARPKQTKQEQIDSGELTSWDNYLNNDDRVNENVQV